MQVVFNSIIIIIVIITIILKSFQKIWFHDYRDLQPSLFSHFWFSCISYRFSSFISISFLIWSIHLCLPIGRFPPIFVCSIFLGILSSAILPCSSHVQTILIDSFVCHFLFHALLVPILC